MLPLSQALGRTDLHGQSEHAFVSLHFGYVVLLAQACASGFWAFGPSRLQAEDTEEESEDRHCSK